MRSCRKGSSTFWYQRCLTPLKDRPDASGMGVVKLFLFFGLTHPLFAATVPRIVLELKNQVRVAHTKKLSAELNLGLAKQKMVRAEYEVAAAKHRLNTGLGTPLDVSSSIITLMEAQISKCAILSTLGGETISEKSALVRLAWAVTGTEKT